MSFDFTPGNVKVAMKEAGASSADLWQVDYSQLHVLPGFNVREHDAAYKAHITNLANLMVANGYQRDKPMAGYVVVRNGFNQIVITDGHCRYEAIPIARSLGADIVRVPVVVKPSGTSAEDLAVSMVTSNSGKPLTPYELGTVCKRLQGFGLDEKQIALRLNFTTTYVIDLLFLQGCPEGIRKLVQTGKVSAGVAIEAVRKHGDKAQEVLEGAVGKAEAKGKAKATTKDLEPTWKAEVKKAGPRLYEALMWVRADGGFKKLSAATQSLIEGLIEDLPEEPQP